MKQILSFLIISLFLFGSQLFAQIVETHEFGETNVYYYVYADGITWDFIAENNMTVETIDVKSVLASDGGTFHIEIRVEGNLIANWDQYVSSTNFMDYLHTKSVSIALHAGDAIEYKIWGGTSSTPVGGIRGISYVKLTGGGGTAYDLQFSSLSDMNDARWGLGYTFDGTYIYAVCGGLSTNPLKSTTIERYDLTSNTWNEFVTGLIPRKYCSAEYVSTYGKIYVLNGETYSGTSYTDTVEVIDEQSGNISYSTGNPYPVEYGGSAVWNARIYVFGGSNTEGYSNRLYEYDPYADSWLRLEDMPEAKQTNGEIINGILYVFGGYNGVTSSRIDAYDIKNSTWSSLGTMPIAISAHATTKKGKNIWIVGSYDNITSMAVYNTETNEFTQLTSNMTGRRHCGAVIEGDDLYIYGGNQGYSAKSVLSSLEYADISNYNFAIGENHDPGNLSSKCYPNPFTEHTTIEFSLQQDAQTSVTVFDPFGKKIETLIDDYLSAGEQRLHFDGSGLAGGMYFYIIRSGKFSITGKMLLRK